MCSNRWLLKNEGNPSFILKYLEKFKISTLINKCPGFPGNSRQKKLAKKKRLRKKKHKLQFTPPIATNMEVNLWLVILVNVEYFFFCATVKGEKQSPKGPSLDSAPKVHKSGFLHKEINKEKNIWKTWCGIDVFSFFLGNENLLRSMGNPSTKPKVLPWIAWCFNMALRSMFGDSSLHILKATIKGSKPEFNTKSSQIEHFI